MSLYQKASLVQIPSGYKAADDKLYSVVPNNGDGDFTVTVAAGATRVNKDGLVETVAADQARLDYDPTNPQDPHLLLEPARRNIVDYSEQFDQWTASSSASVTTNQGTSPDGSNTSDKLTSGATGSRVSRAFTYSNNSTMVFSVFVKNIDATNIKIGISDNITGVCNATFIFSTESISAANQGSWTNTSASVVDFGNGWYRLILISTKGAGSILSPRIEFTESGKNVLVWGAQLEDNGSFGSVDYPTSYIPTSGLAVTRTADTCKLENFADIPTSYPFTAFVDMDIIEDEKGYGFSILDISSSSNYFSVGYSEDSGTLGKFRFSNRAQGSSYNFNTTSTYGTGRYKVAIKFISATNFKAFIDGVEVADYTHTSSAFNTNIDDILLGQLRVSGDVNTRNTVYQFMLFNEALTDSELQTLTS